MVRKKSQTMIKVPKELVDLQDKQGSVSDEDHFYHDPNAFCGFDTTNESKKLILKYSNRIN